MNDMRRELLQDQYDALLAEHEAAIRERDLMRAAIREAWQAGTEHDQEGYMPAFSALAWDTIVDTLGLGSDAPLVELRDEL